MPLSSLMDEEYLAMSRSHINSFLRLHLDPIPAGKILEVGPKLAWPQFDTCDIDPGVRATYTADICVYDHRHPNPPAHYDMVIIISVLEHVIDPARALDTCRTLLKGGGLLIGQTPLNFRQHGPQPDLWRFTENGLRYMLRDWDDVQIGVLDTPERPLFPIAYTFSARCNKAKESSDWKPQWITR